MSTGIVWFRADLRLSDNPAWAAATREHDRVVALFVVEPRLMAAASERRRDLLLAHLADLDAGLRSWGGRLRIATGDPVAVVPQVVAEVGAEAVHLDGDVTPYAVARDRAVAAAVPVVAHHGRTIHPVGSITTRTGLPFRVFTPFHRAWAGRAWGAWPDPGEAAVASDPGDGVPRGPHPPMPPGEAGAAERLSLLLGRVDGYEGDRNRPDLDRTSRLSADLRFGTISPRTVAATVGDGTEGRRAFVRQLAWREFYAQVMLAFPHTVERALRPEFDTVPWREDPADLAAWQEGRTGYPIVDAGMRQLAAEGWMHNRVRMITASFLVKDLLLDWRLGERWFRHLLLDADLPQNVGNWQWVAGTGADAAPYFRIFNPVTQSCTFDPNGDYIRRWVPELRGLAADVIHAPWEAPEAVLIGAGVVLGDSYPAPIVDHAFARTRTLEAFGRVVRG